MHIFLTGPVQIGKSTLISAALDALQPERLGGFRTVSAKPEADGSRPVYLHPAAAQDLLCGAQNRVGIRRPELGIASFPDAFETAGMDALEDAEDCDLVLMDEIGRMERHADAYSARIRTLLDGAVPILGVVQKKADTPLAAAIRSHPNVRLLEVSAENRDVLLPEILNALRSLAPEGIPTHRDAEAARQAVPDFTLIFGESAGTCAYGRRGRRGAFRPDRYMPITRRRFLCSFLPFLTRLPSMRSRWSRFSRS